MKCDNILAFEAGIPKLSVPQMFADDHTLLEFLDPQLRAHSGQIEIETDLWLLFAVKASDHAANEMARTLLKDVTFAHDSGLSADDEWMLYYVDTTNRPAALHWLDDLSKATAGKVRPTAPAHRAIIEEIVGSAMPHRVAQRLVDLHARGALSAGSVRDPRIVRALLDRLHQREPLFFAAFHSLLAHHLIDMVVLLQQLIPEDLSLQNEIVAGSLSRDPFLQSRQDATAAIRNILIRFRVINPLDQQKITAITNPYAAFLDIARSGERILASIDGNAVPVEKKNFIEAIRSIRRNLYRGEKFEHFDTQAPWITEEIAYPFRFIKQRLDSRRDLAVMDGLYMLERAVEV